MDRLVQIAQISLPLVITASLTLVGFSINQRVHKDNQRQIKANTAIKVVDLLKEAETKEAAATLALSFFQEGHLQPSVFPIISDTAVRTSEPELRQFYLRKLSDLQSGIENGEIEFTNLEESEDLTEIQNHINKALRQAGAEVGKKSVPLPDTHQEKTQTIREDTGLLAEAASHATESLAKNILIVDATKTTGETTASPLSAAPVDTVAETLSKISETAIEQASAAQEVIQAESSSAEATATKQLAKTEKDEAIKKTNAVLNAAVVAKKEVIAETATATSGDEDKRIDGAKVQESAEEVVQKVGTKALENFLGEENAEARTQFFKDTGITRLIVMLPNQSGEELERASAVESTARKKLADLLAKAEDSEVISAIDKRWGEGKRNGAPTEDELRYPADQEGGSRNEAIANTLAIELKNQLGVMVKPKASSAVAKDEFEIWLTDPDLKRPSNSPHRVQPATPR